MLNIAAMWTSRVCCLTVASLLCTIVSASVDDDSKAIDKVSVNVLASLKKIDNEVTLTVGEGLDYDRAWPLTDRWYVCAREIKLSGLKEVTEKVKQEKTLLVDGYFLKIVEYHYSKLNVDFKKAAVEGMAAWAHADTGANSQAVSVGKDHIFTALIFYKDSQCEIELSSDTYFLFGDPNGIRGYISKLSYLVNWHTKRISPLFYEKVAKYLNEDRSLGCSVVWTSSGSASKRWLTGNHPEIQNKDRFGTVCKVK